MHAVSEVLLQTWGLAWDKYLGDGNMDIYGQINPRWSQGYASYVSRVPDTLSCEQ